MTPAEIASFAPLVKACAKKFTPSFLPASIDRDDLEAVAWHALVAAERTFDATLGVPFAAYAWIKMRSAVLDEIRSQRHGKRAGERDGALEPDSFTDAFDRVFVEDGTDMTIDLCALREAFATLSERDRYLLSAQVEGRPDAEVGVTLGLTVGSVVSLRSRARSRLRNQVAA